MGLFFINWINSLEVPTRNLLLRTTIFFIYLLIGAIIFHYLESDNSLKERQKFIKIKVQMKRQYGINETAFNDFIAKVKDAIDDGYYRFPGFDRWSFFGSLFFAATVVTTVGYGHLTPRTFGGRLFCMIYAFFGIPVTALMLKSFGDQLVNIIDSIVGYIDTRLSKVKERRSPALRTSIILFLIMMSLIFILAGCAMQYEGWSFFEGVYFAFITLSTIGFGDFVPTSPEEDKRGYARAYIAIFILISFVYITVGLAVVSSVLVSLSRVFEENTEWSFVALNNEESDAEEEFVHDTHEDLLREQEPPKNFFSNK